MTNTLSISGAARRLGFIVLWTVLGLPFLLHVPALAASEETVSKPTPAVTVEQLVDLDISALNKEELTRLNQDLLQMLIQTRRDVQARRLLVESETEEGRLLQKEMNDLRRQLEAKERAMLELMAQDESIIKWGANEKILAGTLRQIAEEIQKRAAASETPSEQ